MALHLEMLVRAGMSDGRMSAANRTVVPLVSGSFDGIPLSTAMRLCREDAARFPESRSWVLRIAVP